MNLDTLSYRCFELNEMLQELYYYKQYNFSGVLDVAQWLRLASGIVSVDFNTIKFDENFGWCSGADEYYLKKDTVHSQYIILVTKFMFIWNSIEILIEDVVKPPKKNKYNGKITIACEYIKKHFSVIKSGYKVEQYYQSVTRFHKYLDNLD